MTYKRLTNNQENWVACAAEFGLTSPVSRPDVLAVCEEYDLPIPQWLVGKPVRRYGRGLYDLPELSDYGQDELDSCETVEAPASVASPATAPAPMTFNLASDEGIVPDRIDTYVPFGHFKDVEKVIKSKVFYPCFITGLSGNGKTTMVEQVCAKLKRPCYRVNITAETDEDDLLGGFRLVNGNTVWADGPVVRAMEDARGGVLLVDEIDLASSKIMCLQSVLEGKGVYLKKINRWVTPAKGFTVIATANTKGKGDEAGRFIGTNVLNEAFLDRFPVTIEQEYPTRAQEVKILNKRMDANGTTDTDFAENLVKWAEIVRKSFYEGAVDEIITTRRLVNICEAFGIFGCKEKSIDMAISRFDVDTKEAFKSLYMKLDEEVATDHPLGVSETDLDNLKCPF